jgi:hypothetical protein
MIPSKYANSLYFTPRTPWGTRIPRRALQNPTQASADNPAGRKPNAQQPATAASTETRPRPPVDPRDRDIVRQPGDVAPSVKEQLQKDIEWNRKQGYASNRSLTLQQTYESDNLMRDAFPDRPEASTAAPKEKHWSGSIGRDGVRGPKDEADSVQATIQYSTRPGVKEADDRKQQKFKPSEKYPDQIDERELNERANPEFPDDD